jgi:hypothetical protein
MQFYETEFASNDATLFQNDRYFIQRFTLDW